MFLCLLSTFTLLIAFMAPFTVPPPPPSGLAGRKGGFTESEVRESLRPNMNSRIKIHSKSSILKSHSHRTDFRVRQPPHQRDCRKKKIGGETGARKRKGGEMGGWNHGLINYKDTKPLMSSLLVSSRMRYSQSCWFFSMALWTIVPLSFSLVSSAPPPLPCVKKYTVYTFTVFM